MIRTALKNAARRVKDKIRKWRYRSSKTGEFLSREVYDKLPPETTQRERIK